MHNAERRLAALESAALPRALPGIVVVHRAAPGEGHWARIVFGAHEPEAEAVRARLAREGCDVEPE